MFSSDASDEYIKIGESTTIESCKRFFCAVMEVFAECYLISPASNDVARLLHIGKNHCFLGMLGCWKKNGFAAEDLTQIYNKNCMN